MATWMWRSHDFHRGRRNHFFSKKRPTFLDVCVLSNRVRVVIKIDPNFQFRFGGKGHSSLSEPIIMLEPEQPKSLQWFVDAIHRFENFLSLCLGYAYERTRNLWVSIIIHASFNAASVVMFLFLR